MDAYQAIEALADPTRRSVYELIAARPRAVSELAAELPVSRPAVSQHLKVLWGAGLVRAEAQGTRRIYHADTRGLESLRDYLEGFWNHNLAAFRRAVEQPITTDQEDA